MRLPNASRFRALRNTCEARVGKNRGSTFQMTTTPNPAQHRALRLLQAITG
jgi:hypothetical protein